MPIIDSDLNSADKIYNELIENIKQKVQELLAS